HWCRRRESPAADPNAGRPNHAAAAICGPAPSRFSWGAAPAGAQEWRHSPAATSFRRVNKLAARHRDHADFGVGLLVWPLAWPLPLPLLVTVAGAAVLLLGRGFFISRCSTLDS